MRQDEQRTIAILDQHAACQNVAAILEVLATDLAVDQHVGQQDEFAQLLGHILEAVDGAAERRHRDLEHLASFDERAIKVDLVQFLYEDQRVSHQRERASSSCRCRRCRPAASQ